MKRKHILLLAIVLISTISLPAFCGKDQPITFNQLPAAAQQIIRQHFPGSKVALAKMEKEFFGKSYEVIFTNGNKLEFDSNGQWTSLDCKYTWVPQALIPAAIKQYVKTSFPNTKVTELERHRRGYEVELSNRIDIKFNKSFKVIEIDD